MQDQIRRSNHLVIDGLLDLQELEEPLLIQQILQIHIPMVGTQ
jgi:hypothetical protein